MKKAFTLVEAIITIVIIGILSAGTFVALKHLYLRAAKAKAFSELSSDSQVIADQIASLLYYRVPSSVIGYKGDGSFGSIYNMETSYQILEWIGSASEGLKAGYYSGFVDLNASDKTTQTITSYDINTTALDTLMADKFDGGSTDDLALIFAGSFDDGALSLASDFNSSFGWHAHNHNLLYTLQSLHTNSITLDASPDIIYEKYYLVDSAYAIARGADIDLNATCIRNLNQSIDNNTLFLFYNYRPWKNQTFCADPHGGSTQDGNVTILSSYVTGFQTGLINGNIKFDVTLTKKIRGSEHNVTISKQKVVF
ncbi:prepilin-type N-terminal cleavage/methylation domain-containing protein [Sulfurospirillum sp. 1612]|uniref:prepilin-type N-terminal cleavage/methylation domain-containing protein n=1 Tax=Sulfurospirillum sp. 1612 TaxID=3094835 RepID=UPI002F94C87F